MLNQATCPVCYSGNSRKLWNVDCNSAAQHFVIREKDEDRHRRLSEVVKKLWGRNSCKVLECTACGFCYADPYVAGSKEFYDLAYQRRKGGYPDWKWEFQKTIKAMASTAPTKRKFRILEVGAGNGGFVKAIINHDIAVPQNIVCTEYSDYGRNEILSIGVKCYTQDIEDIKFQKKFDSITMFQVLEHMDDLDSLFSTIRSVLSPGGSLFISVPNKKRIAFNENNGGLLDMPPNHIGRWSPKSFMIIGERHGLEMIDYDIEPFKLIPSLKEFAEYKYLRSLQNRGSIANYSERQPNRIKRITCRCVALLPIVLSIPFLSFKMNRDMGGSQWVHYAKNRKRLVPRQLRNKQKCLRGAKQ